MNMKTGTNGFSNEEITAAHNHFMERDALYKKYGLERAETRRVVFRQLSADNDSILEVGTGKGQLTAMLAGFFNRVVSVDIDSSEQRIAMLNTAYSGLYDKIEFITSDAGKLAFPDRSFDAVVSSFTFHHLEFPFKVIREMVRIAINQIVISDFNRRGFETVEKIHKLDGKTHVQMPGDFSIVGVYLKEFNFDVKIIENEFQTTYTAMRRSNF